MARFANSVLFLPTAGGTTDFTVSSAVTGFMTPALAGMPDGTYKYRAESSNLSQWEIGEGVYTQGASIFDPNILTRATVLYNSSGTGTASGQSGAGSKINFSAPPNVGVVQLVEDTLGIDQSNSWSDAQKLIARNNIGAGVYAATRFTASGTFTTPSDSTTSTIYRYKIQGAGGGGGGGSTTTAAGGGGGGGAYAEGIFTGVSPSTGITVTVGTGGTAGTAAGGSGGAGGSSSLGAPVSITSGGGSAGAGSTSGIALAGVGGAVTGSPNLLNISGQRGEDGISGTSGSFGGGGNGGDSHLGTRGLGGRANIGSSAISAPTGYGSGGGASFAAGNPGAGKEGIVIIERLTP